MSELRNCEYCKKLYNDNIDFPICNTCNQKLEKEIKDYINNNKDVSISDIVKDTGISEKIVKIYLKSKKIEFSDSIEMCKNPDCYNMVDQGKEMCPSCLKKAKLINALGDLYTEVPYKNNKINKSSNSEFHLSIGRRR